jgi:hypothetical protein
MADNLAQIPTDLDPDRLRRMLALSGNAPNNVGGAPRLSPIASPEIAPLPLGDEARQRISQGA